MAQGKERQKGAPRADTESSGTVPCPVYPTVFLADCRGLSVMRYRRLEPAAVFPDI